MGDLVPLPVSVVSAGGTFELTSEANIYVEPATAEMMAIGQYLAARLRPATGYAIPVVAASAATPSCAGSLYLTTAGGDPTLGNEGYELTVAPGQVRLSAYQPAGVFFGVQTIRQLLPAAIESSTAESGPWGIAAGTIRDYPRFPWRGALLDVARHFFGVADVETYLDLLAYYKINTFHIHLTDDQGWRIAIHSWPNLAVHGGSTEVDGGPGGYYTQADFSSIVAYAKSRYITVVPEIDMPGHTNAALASYPELNCNGMGSAALHRYDRRLQLLCISSTHTYPFVADVVGEVAALTDGAYFHVGGDEATATSASDFQTFFSQVQPLVETSGKAMVGWDAIGQISDLLPTSIVQYWNPPDGAFVSDALGRGAKVLMSPANKAYMDMKYDPSTTLGQNWAGYIDEETAYTWDPATILSGVTEADLVGLEAPLWSETLQTLADIEYMAFPRIAGYAEIGWSQATGRAWDEYKVRVGSQGPRWRELGIHFYESSAIPWQ